jgi:hypothetical protein
VYLLQVKPLLPQDVQKEDLSFQYSKDQPPSIKNDLITISAYVVPMPVSETDTCWTATCMLICPVTGSVEYQYPLDHNQSTTQGTSCSPHVAACFAYPKEPGTQGAVPTTLSERSQDNTNLYLLSNFALLSACSHEAKDHSVKMAISHALAQSCKLSVYEERVWELVEKVGSGGYTGKEGLVSREMLEIF